MKNIYITQVDRVTVKSENVHTICPVISAYIYLSYILSSKEREKKNKKNKEDENTIK